MKHRCIAALLSLPLAISAAWAAEAGDGPSIQVSGFGSLAATRTNTDQAQFGRPGQGSGARKRWDTGVDSNLGLQANVAINDWLSGTVQGLVRKDAEDDVGADLAWAFVRARLSDKLSVRVGRMGLPVFMISDYRSVGYSNTMLRPPAEMYAQVPLNSVDGADAIYAHSVGATTLTAQFAVGRTQSKLNGGGNTVVHLDGKSIRAFNLVAENGPLTLRLGRLDTKITIADSTAINGLMGALRATGGGYGFPELGRLAGALELKDKKASFTSVGMIWDWSNVVMQSEYAKRKTDSYANDTTSWYLMAGYRTGKFLPYYSHADLKSDGRVANTVPASCPAGYPAACTPTLRALSAGVTAISSSGREGEQSSDAIGVRWDFNRSAALKVQIDRIKPKRGQGLMLQPAPGYTGPFTAAAVSVDFVF